MNWAYARDWVKVRLNLTYARDRAARTVARLLPRRVVYWAALRLGAHATMGAHSRQEVPSLTFMEALERW